MMNVLSESFVGGALGQRWCRSPRGHSLTSHSAVEKHLFARAKKGTKETRPRRHALRAARAGSASGPGISVRHIHVPYGNAVIHDGALRVLPGPLAAPHGDPKATSTAKTRADPSGTALGPLRSGSHGGRNPAGAAHRTCPVFGRGRMPRPKIPAGTAHPPRSGGRTAGGCFFCLLFFAQAKKSRAPAASGTKRGQQRASAESHDGQAPFLAHRLQLLRR